MAGDRAENYIASAAYPRQDSATSFGHRLLDITVGEFMELAATASPLDDSVSDSPARRSIMCLTQIMKCAHNPAMLALADERKITSMRQCIKGSVLKADEEHYHFSDAVEVLLITPWSELPPNILQERLFRKAVVV